MSDGDVPGLVIRPEVRDTIRHDHHMDRMGRLVKAPRRLSMYSFLRSVPGLARQFSPIPGAAWQQDTNDEGYSEAVVACPCGETPHVEVGRVEECACERFYFFQGVKVLIANSPHRNTETSVPT